MVPLVSDVYSGVRSVLGDTNSATGQVFTDSLLQPHYQTAYSELFRAMQGAQNPRIRQESYVIVPAYTGYLDPATGFMYNVGEIESVEERGNVTSWAISNVVPGTGVATVTSAATTLATGDEAVVIGVGGITDDVNGIWTITVNSTTSTQLNGCSATGTYTTNTGTLSTSSEQFQEMTPQQRISFINQAPQDTFRVYAWEKDVFRFPPCGNIRQLHITYTLSGDAPTTTTASTGIDDCLDFLKYRVAGMAGPSKGMLQRAAIYTNLAVGGRWVSDGIPGGILGQLLDSGVRNLQRLPPSQRRSPPFGVNRSRRWRVW